MYQALLQELKEFSDSISFASKSAKNIPQLSDDAFRNFFCVISLKPGRITFAKQKGGILVQKNTKEFEAQQLLAASKFLSAPGRNFFSTGAEVYKIDVPTNAAWNEKKKRIEMDCCNGLNVEYRLRECTIVEERRRLVTLIHDFILWMQHTGFLWRDAAPRNMIVHESAGHITLVDFERPLIMQNEPITDDVFRLNLRGNIHEEFAAFLSPEEQDRIFGTIWNPISISHVPRESILSIRQLLLLKYFYGDVPDQVPIENLVRVQRLMVEVASPISTVHGLFFPMLYLAKGDSAPQYLETVLALDSLPKEQWPQYFKKTV